MSRDNERWVADLSRDGAEREAALRELRDALLRNLRKALSNRPRADDAFLEDAVQDSLLRIMDRLNQFAGRSQFLTWATSIAIRIAIGELRRSHWRDVSLDELTAKADIVSERAISGASGPGALVDRQAIFEKMHYLIENELTEKQRTALLAEMKGMPQDEIARHFGSNRNAVYKLTHDARKKLKRGFENAGYTAEELVAAAEN